MQTTLARRQFLSLTASAVAGVLIESRAATVSTDVPVQAIAFDAFPIFDPRPIFALVEELYPGKGAELGKGWRTRQFEYTWLRTVAGRYADFWQVTEDALIFAAKDLKLDLDSQRRARLMNAYMELKPWPDVLQALGSLKAAGIRLAFLSNFSRRMLEAGIRNSGLDGMFEQLLSTDEVKQFKPAPRAYQMAVDALGLQREAIVFAAFAGWDASGAKWFGFPTVWVNRMSLATEELKAFPDLTCSNLSGLVVFAKSRH
jgi:2-haloacid dehalogenase